MSYIPPLTVCDHVLPGDLCWPPLYPSLSSQTWILNTGKQNRISTVMTLSFRTDRSKEQSDQSLHCLQLNLHLFDEIPKDLASLFEF